VAQLLRLFRKNKVYIVLSDFVVKEPKVKDMWVYDSLPDARRYTTFLAAALRSICREKRYAKKPSSRGAKYFVWIIPIGMHGRLKTDRSDSPELIV
jgi:hypothetical protein